MAKSETSTVLRPPRAGLASESWNRWTGSFGHFPGLVRHGAVAVAVDVPVLVAPADDVVTALAQDRAGGAAEHLLALLVPENDPVGGIDREDGFAAAGDPVERFVGLRHVGLEVEDIAYTA